MRLFREAHLISRAMTLTTTIWGVASISAVSLFLAASAFVYFGIYNVAATDPHWSWVSRIMEIVRVRSIKAHASDVAAPSNLRDEAMILMGVEHFAAHCAVCHGAPGVPKGDIALGLYPEPPDLAQSSERYRPNEIFWIVKNGIKMSGMPSWKDHDEEELWSTVAFILKLPEMTEDEYGRLLMESMINEDHH